MMAFWLVLTFGAGVVFGWFLLNARFSFLRKEHEAKLRARHEALQREDAKAIKKFKQEIKESLKDYREKLDKLILEESLIKAEEPGNGWWN